MNRTATKALVTLGSLAAGIPVGFGGALWTGGSDVGVIFSVLALPAGFVLGMYSWLWIGIAGMIVNFLSRRRWPPVKTIEGHPVPPGAWAFPVICPVTAALGGLGAGFVPGGPGPLTAALVFGIGGWLYGRGLHGLARRGHLLVPDPS